MVFFVLVFTICIYGLKKIRMHFIMRHLYPNKYQLTLDLLVVLYEHKFYVMSVIWQGQEGEKR